MRTKINQKELKDNLVETASVGDVQGVLTLLQAHSTYGFTHDANVHAGGAIVDAASKGSTEMVQLLLQHGAYVNI